MENKVKRHREDLEKLKNEFNLQLQELNKTKDISQFHDHLTEIISKHPEKKDLIKFITFVNDEISRDYQNYNEIFIEVLNDLLDKHKIMANDIEDFLDSKKQKSNNDESKLKLIFNHIKDVKFILGATILVLILIIALIDPTLLDKLFNDVFHFFKIIFTGKI